jgi:transcription antitermination protein NusB
VTAPAEKKTNDPVARRAARLAAVQALYQMELTNENAEMVAQEFLDHGFGQDVEAAPVGEPDAEFFTDLLRGVPKHQVEIDRSVARCLSENWKLERIDSILRAILRAGSYELIARADVPAKVVIDEYLDITHAFFQGDEPGFVNAALDKLARDKRVAEFGKRDDKRQG